LCEHALGKNWHRQIIDKEDFMKKAVKLFGIIAIVALIGLSIAGCDDGSSSAGTVLPAPTGLRATTYSSSRVDLYWNPVSGAAGYNVYYSRTSSSSGFSLLGTVYSNANNAHTGASSYTLYYYKVAAYTADGREGRMSSVVNARTLRY
jgi:hypothetical protein